MPDSLASCYALMHWICVTKLPPFSPPPSQGFLLNSTQQQVAKLVLQTGEAARTLKRTQAVGVGGGELPPHLQELCTTTDSLIVDAEHSKQVTSLAS